MEVVKKEPKGSGRQYFLSAVNSLGACIVFVRRNGMKAALWEFKMEED
jgi:hypothetical protein